MAKAKVDIPEKLLARYDQLIASHPDIDRKGKNNPYTSLNGHMFTFLRKDGVMGMRMSKADREAFIEQHDSNLIVTYNTVMKEYVEIPDALWEDGEKMAAYLQKSFEYVSSLKPKPTKKKAPKK